MIGARSPRAPRLGRRIVPVEPLAAGDRRTQSRRVVRPGKPIRIAARHSPRRASRTAACSCRCRPHRSPDAPTADRGGNRRRRVPSSRLVAEILAPVRAVGDLRRRPEHRRALRRPASQSASTNGKCVVLVAQRGQPAQLRADQERIDAAGRRRQLRIVQHEAPVAPVAGEPEKSIVFADAGKLAAAARRRRNASTCARAAAVRSADPGISGAGSQVMRPRQG